MRRTRRSFAALLAVALTAAVAAPVLAAKPTREVIDIGTPDDEAAAGAYLTELCGFTITASSDSTVTVLIFSDSTGAFVRQINIYQIRSTFTNAETGASVFLHDVGPDIFWLNEDEELMLALVGRSLTGSGVIGRVVINLDTGETLLAAGLNVGTLEDQICDPLAA